MRSPDESQEFAETVVLTLLNNGLLAGGVFRHGDSALKAQAEAITVQAGQPVPQLSGSRGYRVDVSIEIRSPQSGRNAAIYGECIQRIMNASRWRSAALSAGMTINDDLDVLDEEITGDRNDGRQLRKRTIMVPMLLNINPPIYPIVTPPVFAYPSNAIITETGDYLVTETGAAIIYA